LIILDEIDFVYQKYYSITFFDILKLPYLTDTEMKYISKIFPLLLVISNDCEFEKKISHQFEDRNMAVEKLVFTPYTNYNMLEIMVKILDEIKLTYLFQKESLIYISRRFANKSGDIRPALELIKNLILSRKDDLDILNKHREIINQTGSSKAISPDKIASVDMKESESTYTISLKDIISKLNEKNNNFKQLISNLTDEQKLFIATVYSTLDKDESCEIDDKTVSISIIIIIY
jgi:Cdc6-like AAA superfamily ATPase